MWFDVFSISVSVTRAIRREKRRCAHLSTMTIECAATISKVDVQGTASTAVLAATVTTAGSDAGVRTLAPLIHNPTYWLESFYIDVFFHELPCGRKFNLFRK
jgi:hypothetical protein